MKRLLDRFGLAIGWLALFALYTAGSWLATLFESAP